MKTGGLTSGPLFAAAIAMTSIRVLLADDHAILRESLADMLGREADLEIVGQAGDGNEAVEMSHQLHPDVVIMDIDMPKLNGIEATRKISEELPRIRVIGLSMHEKADMGAAMAKAGAVRYISKDRLLNVLPDAIRSARSPCQTPDSLSSFNSQSLCTL